MSDSDEIFLTMNERKYVEYKINYPSMTRGELFAFFGTDLVNIEKTSNVLMKLALIKKQELDIAEEMKEQQEYSRLRRQEKMESMKDRAMEIMEEMLYQKDKKYKWEAAKRVMDDEYAYNKRLKELKAESDLHKAAVDEPYIEPSGPMGIVDRSGKIQSDSSGSSLGQNGMDEGIATKSE